MHASELDIGSRKKKLSISKLIAAIKHMRTFTHAHAHTHSHAHPHTHTNTHTHELRGGREKSTSKQQKLFFPFKNEKSIIFLLLHF